MPLVMIHVLEGRRDDEALRALADTVHQVVLEHFDAPAGDRYQIITEHRRGLIIAEDTGLGFDRTDDLVVLRLVQQGRTTERKQDFYREVARRLQQETGLAPTDLIVSVVANEPEDWSFGLGEAQFLTGAL